MLLLVAFCCLLLALFWFYRSRQRRFSVFERLGIPGPKPSLLFGNLAELMEKGAVKVFDEWIHKYGDVVGFYNGAEPVLMIKDLDVIKEIQVHDFSNFYERGVTSTILREHKVTKTNLQHAAGESWRNMRGVLTKQFTPSKLKKLVPVMNECANEFMKVMESLHFQEEAIDILEIFQDVSLNITFRSIFGGHGRSELNQEDTKMKIIKSELRKFIAGVGNGWLRFVIDSFPEFPFLWRGLLFLRGHFMKFSADKIQEQVYELICERLSSSTESHDDLLHVLLTSKFDGGGSVNNQRLSMSNGDESLQYDQLKRNKEKREFLSLVEIQSNIQSALIDGYDNSPSLMSCMAFLLAMYPEVQERLRTEVTPAMNTDGSMDVARILRNEYLDQVILETIRIYPPLVSFTTRKSEEERLYNGLKIPAKMSVLIPVYQMHHDPKLWDDPETFRPERFNNANGRNFNPMAFQAFGHGPRNCVGMRFVQQQLKLTFAKILGKYKIIPDDRYVKGDHLELSTAFIFCKPRDGVWLKFEKIHSGSQGNE